MSSVRNWALGVIIAALILLGPVIAIATLITAEMLTDLAMKTGATAVWPAAAGALCWLLFRKFGRRPNAPQLGSEGARQAGVWSPAD
jgi:predicted membrane protein